METLRGNTEGTQEPGKVSTKQPRIAELARKYPERSFVSLAHQMDLEWMKEAYRRTRKDGAVGVDEQRAEEYAVELEENLKRRLERFKSGEYQAPPVRRVHIPKGRKGETRPIGVPTFEDKILQRAVLMLLEPLYEQDFLDCSCGFRPGRSAHQALRKLREGIMQMQGGWVVDVDIRKYLETVSYYTPIHERLLKRAGCASMTLIRKPLRFPCRTWTAASSPRLTGCNTV